MFKKKIEKIFYKFIAKPNVQQIKPLFASIPTVKLNQEDVLPIYGTSTIFKIQKNNKTFYFRECRKHLELDPYVACFISDFFKFCNPKYQCYQDLILSQLKQKKTFYSFLNMGTPFDKRSLISHYLKTRICTLFDLRSYSQDHVAKSFLFDFLVYSWSNLYTYHLNSGLKIGEYEVYSAIRQLATKEIANTIGVGSLIPETDLAFLCLEDGRKRLGTIMKDAGGVRIQTLKINKETLNPIIQRELNNLNVLDVLCFERDHRPSNYSIRFDSNTPCGVCAFDNDSPMSFNSPSVYFTS